MISDAIQERRPGVAIAIELDCGKTWEEALDGEDPPLHIEALAFLLPGELPIKRPAANPYKSWSIGMGQSGD